MFLKKWTPKKRLMTSSLLQIVSMVCLMLMCLSITGILPLSADVEKVAAWGTLAVGGFGVAGGIALIGTASVAIPICAIGGGIATIVVGTAVLIDAHSDDPPLKGGIQVPIRVLVTGVWGNPHPLAL